MSTISQSVERITTTVIHTVTAATSATSATSTAAAHTQKERPPAYKAVGVALAIASGCFIGVSFVLKKKGLLQANAKDNSKPGEGVGYLKNAWWWTGMILMILGELCNFAAYAFVEAILVTPLGALSVVITAILSSIFLKERLSFVGKIGCFACLVGAAIIVINAPEQSSAATIQDMKHFVIAPGFLSYAGVVIASCVFIVLWAGPRYGDKSMLVYLSVCSLIGGLSVVATQGLGAAIVTQIAGTPQFNQWFLYVLLVFVVATLLTEIFYLNKALNIFNAALVTPTYYVLFTTSTIVTSAVLFRGFKGTPSAITTLCMGFLEICAGVVLLQLSKSAKDIPDAAVFRGDLDQVKAVAEIEEPESEPKADAIRGTAAIIRRLSTVRKHAETREMERLAAEKAADVRGDDLDNENLVVEWDGLRRRVSWAGPREQGRARRNTSASSRPTTNRMLSRLEEMEEGRASQDLVRVPTEHAGVYSKDAGQTGGVTNFSKPRAQSTFVLGSSSYQDIRTDPKPISLKELTIPKLAALKPGEKNPSTTGLTEKTTINFVPSSPEHKKHKKFGRRHPDPAYDDYDDDEKRSVAKSDTSTLRPESEGINKAKRQFSFQNMWARLGHSHQPVGQEDPADMDEDDPRLYQASGSGPSTNIIPPTPTVKLFESPNVFPKFRESVASSNLNVSPGHVTRENSARNSLTRIQTEEERLGLVSGDAGSAQYDTDTNDSFIGQQNQQDHESYGHPASSAIIEGNIDGNQTSREHAERMVRGVLNDDNNSDSNSFTASRVIVPARKVVGSGASVDSREWQSDVEDDRPATGGGSGSGPAAGSKSHV